MRILVLAHGHPQLSAGGAETAAYALFEHLKQVDGVFPLFVASAPPELFGPNRGVMSFRGRPDEILIPASGREDLSLCSHRPVDVAERLRALVEEFAPDIIHVHHYLGVGLQALGTIAQLNVRIVLTLHEYLAICHHHGQMMTTTGKLCYAQSPGDCAACFPAMTPPAFFSRRQLVSHYLSGVDRFVSPSAFLAKRYQDWPGWSGQPIDIIENPLSPFAFQPVIKTILPLTRVRKSIGFFGRFTPFKGIDVLLRAVRMLSQEERKMLSIGLHGGGLETQAEGFRATVGGLLEELNDCVLDFGSYTSERAVHLMRRYDWLVMPSTWWENSPVVIQEALAAGVPVIVGNIGGMAEKIVDGVNGLHFEAGSAVDLSQLLGMIVRGEQVPPHVAPSGAAEVTSTAVEKLLQLYRETLNGPAVNAAPQWNGSDQSAAT